MTHIFVLRKTSTRSPNNVTINCRVTIAGDRHVRSTGLRCERNQWNASKHRVKGNSPDAVAINEALCQIDAGLLNLKRTADLICLETIDAIIMRSVPQDKDQTWQSWVAKYVKQVNERHVEASTLRSILSRVEKLTEWMRKRRLATKSISFITTKVLKDLVADLTKELKPEYLHKVWHQLKSILAFAISDKAQLDALVAGVILPMRTDKEVVALVQSQVDTLVKWQPRTAVLEHVRDLFLFQCYTGLARADVNLVNATTLVKINGYDFFVYQRKKTKKETGIQVPAFPIPLQIFNKYNGVLPQMTDQVFNRYLKHLAQEVGLNMTLTSHVGRKTFASLLYNSGVPMSSVTALLGHSDPKVTLKHYAKLQTSTLIQDIAKSGFGQILAA